ncbi:pseudouridine synthase PUS7 [Aspergillus clavatus NRRL 1]|uniref:Pseudouridine synthase TruD/Pus7, putative n=1 Tax=Aspergillus clavatus (strain ATCC 1007 / CBS 513.65 / DSM 816 / NCTC 3887 / NRRL 1 / QM 1276 / 107) TaxID=344612 RepID=A1CNF3_ASPCL|nr:pseudouridine synthase TruD/Pus7, putative [Aspergillus clavatus NRRL 1]EAW07174.1 pseudouridine synthase TruD/Pus7, putative [Aspergillus clavatus NRRL 1]
MEGADIVESPRKRLKTENAVSTEDVVLPPSSAPVAETKISDSDAQALKEAEVGITEFVSAENEGFSGVLKKRYTDFLVNEILPSGEVLHLRNLKPTVTPAEATKNGEAESKPETPATTAQAAETAPVTDNAAPTAAEETPVADFQLSEEDKALLESFFGAEATERILALHTRAMANPKSRPNELGRVNTMIVSDRDLRIKIHQAIRRIFNSQLESTTDSEGMMCISAAPNRNKRNTQGGRGGGRDRGRLNWDELGGPYLHFTVYKENKDTMEVISFLARQMKMAPRSFQFAGTKDRRGVTVQRACVTRVFADRLAKLNPTLRNAAIGDYEYRRVGLELGDLKGNEFVVTLRECDIPGIDLQDREAAVTKAKEFVGTALRNLRERGYFNYYGLQRFGTFATRTDTIGVKMLQEDFKGACDAIMHYSPHVLAAAQEGENSTAMIGTDDKARAEAIHLFQTTGQVSEAVEKLPRKFSAENNLIRHLGRSKNDYLGALQTIPRNLRLMYVHAYQSLVWNFAVGERWRLYGDKVVEGDLVLIHEHREKTETGGAEANSGVDADGEVIIVPSAEDSAYSAEDMFERARALTAEEAASGKYSIFDIVLPLPGFDVVYPANAMTDFYKRFMGSEQGGGLDPFDMRRKWKDISLSGSYRKVLSRMGTDYAVDVKLYSQDDEQFVQTDLDQLKGKAADSASGSGAEAGDKIAVVLKFQLGSSQYATMALRELMRGKVVAYKPDFGGGRSSA